MFPRPRRPWRLGGRVVGLSVSLTYRFEVTCQVCPRQGEPWRQTPRLPWRCVTSGSAYGRSADSAGLPPRVIQCSSRSILQHFTISESARPSTGISGARGTPGALPLGRAIAPACGTHATAAYLPLATTMPVAVDGDRPVASGRRSCRSRSAIVWRAARGRSVSDVESRQTRPANHLSALKGRMRISGRRGTNHGSSVIRSW